MKIFLVLGRSRVWVTKKAGEEFHQDCVNEYHKNVLGCMIWGGISRQK